MEDFEQLGEELGRGNYGTVMRVLYRPKKLEMAMKVDYPLPFYQIASDMLLHAANPC